MKYWLTTLLGIALFILGISALVNSIYVGHSERVLWLCYAGLILLGVGIYLRNSFLIGSQVAILGIPLTIWTIDFFYILITGTSLWGITDYFFLEGDTLSKIITLQHIVTIPLALYVLFLIKIKDFTFWRLSLMQIVIFFVASRLFTPLEANMNCVFQSCVPLTLPFPYPVNWFLMMIVMIVVMTVLLYSLPFLHSKKRK